MSAIRSDLPVPQTVISSPSTQVRAAQAAFFRAAMGEASQAAAPGSSAASPSQPPSDGARLSRPGALLDIRV